MCYPCSGRWQQRWHWHASAMRGPYLCLSRAGEYPTFDTAWTIVSASIMTLLAVLFSVELWVA